VPVIVTPTCDIGVLSNPNLLAIETPPLLDAVAPGVNVVSVVKLCTGTTGIVATTVVVEPTESVPALPPAVKLTLATGTSLGMLPS